MTQSSTRESSSGKETAIMRRLDHLGSLDFLQATYRTHHFPPHVHDNFVIELVEEGIDELEYHGRVHHAQAGDVVLIPPGEVHNGHPAGPISLSYRAIYPSPELLAEVAGSLGYAPGTMPKFSGPVLRDSLLAQRLEQLFRALEAAPDSCKIEAPLRATLTTLVRHHAQKTKGAPLRPVPRPAVRRVQDYIRSHASAPLSVAELSAVAQLSVYHFLRVFRKEVGLRPHEFLVNIRVERARSLLSQGRSITETAAETGFADQSHLTRWFKRIMGITPGNFRI